MTFLLYLIYFVLIAGPIYFLYLWWKYQQQQKKVVWTEKQECETLIIEVPKNNDKAPLAAEQMFASLHGIYSDSADSQPHMSFEIISVDKFVQFYMTVPKNLTDFIEGQIYAQYPTVEIHKVDDFTQKSKLEGKFFAGMELETTKPDVFPIKMFSDFEVDPLSGITSVMSKIQPGEEMWLQFIVKPVGDEWQERGISYIDKVKKGTDKSVGLKDFKKTASKAGKDFFKNFFKLVLNPNAEIEGPSAPGEVKLSGPVEDALKSIEYKIVKLGFETKIRLMCIADDPSSARAKITGLGAAFKQFNTTNGNGFKQSEVLINDDKFINDFKERNFSDKGYVLNISELAAIYHLPNQTVETPHIVWAGSKKGEPPSNLPLSENIDAKLITVLGESNFRNVYRKFGIKLEDRRRHCYIVGKSGTGKTTLIENMVIDDVNEGRGVIIVDPHGDLVDKVLTCVPDDRIDDVIVFDPADRAYPIAFNLLDKVEDDFKGMVASGFVGIFKKIFGESWGPRLEHILRNTVLALLDFPESTMLDIPRMLTEKRFREKVVSFVVDPVIKEFWINEFAQYDAKFRTEAVSPILNKVGQFLSTATIRNIVGQPHSRINIREIMDTEKILLINLSRGKIGEDNSALLGAMMITKIQLSAMSRADVTMDKRPDSYLYVDEFQNFATESFAVILSEARKYNLNLTVANQYISQMPEIVRDAVFGNAGTIIAFRVGGADAEFLVKEFEPVFENNDLVNLDRFQIYIKLLIDGMTKPAFSARTLPPVDKVSGNREKIIERSREKYAADRNDVESMIIDKSKELEDELKAESEQYFANRSSDNHTQPKPFSAADSKFNKPASFTREPEKVQVMPENTGLPALAITEPVAKSPDLAGDSETSNKQKIDRPRTLKWQNIIGDKVYKEQTARGGVKWYVGQEMSPGIFEEQGIVVDENGKEMIEIMNKVYDKNIMNGKDVKADPKVSVLTEVEQKINVGGEKTEQPAESIVKTEEQKTPKQPEAKKDDKDKQPAQAPQNSKGSDENTLNEGVAVNL